MGIVSFRVAFNTTKWKANKDELLFAFSCLQEEERQRVRRFVYRRDLKHALIGRLMIRSVVSRALRSPFNELIFDRNEKGKPILTNTTDAKLPFDFNVSHHGDFAVLVAGRTPKIGVDVMRIEYKGGKSLSEFFRLMRRQFSEEEWTFIRGDNQSLSEREMMFRFMRFWCLKESYVKAEGIGISFDLKRISFRCESESLSEHQVTADTTVIVDSVPLTNWTFEECLLDADHCVAVAYERDTSSIDSESSVTDLFEKIEFDELTRNAIPLRPCREDIWNEFLSKSEKPS